MVCERPASSEIVRGRPGAPGWTWRRLESYGVVWRAMASSGKPLHPLGSRDDDRGAF